MAQRHGHLWLKILIGVVAARAAIVDVLALIFVVAPLRASQQACANSADLTAQLTQSTVEQSLILPTRDPRKPWATRTPLPTITPWLIPTATPTSAPANASAPGLAPGIPDTAAPIMPAPAATANPPAETLGPSLTPTGGLRAIAAPGSTPTSPMMINHTSTPTAVHALSTETLVPPTGTPSQTPLPNTPQSPPPVASGDAAEFETYVRDYYDNIVGYPLNILAVTIDTTETGLPEITVHLAYNDIETGFTEWNGKDAADYGHRLLADVKLFFEGRPCALAVVSDYDTLSLDACMSNPSSCIVRTQDPNNNSGSITWIYVLGTFVDGSDSIQTWSAGR